MTTVVFYPSDIFKAIEYKKREAEERAANDPSYKLPDHPEDDAMKIDFSISRTNKKGGRYYNVSFLYYRDDAWNYYPLNLKFMKVLTEGNPVSIKNEQIIQANLIFKGKTFYERRILKNGQQETQKEKLSLAIMFIYEIFYRKMKHAVDTKIISPGGGSKSDIRSIVQKTFKDLKGNEVNIESIEDYIIRVKIPLEFEEGSGMVKKDSKVLIPMYDVTKPVPGSENKKITKIDEKFTRIEVGDPKRAPIRTDLNTIIPPHSEVTGVINLGSACLSGMGISLQAKVSDGLLIKPGNGFGVDILSEFGNDLDEISGSKAVEDAFDALE